MTCVSLCIIITGLASLALFPLLNGIAPANAAGQEVTLPSGLKYIVVEAGDVSNLPT